MAEKIKEFEKEVDNITADNYDEKRIHYIKTIVRLM